MSLLFLHFCFYRRSCGSNVVTSGFLSVCGHDYTKCSRVIFMKHRGIVNYCTGRNN